MDITPLISAGANIINSYGEDNFVINRKSYTGNIILTIDELHPLEINSTQLDELENHQVFKDLANKAEIIIIGFSELHKSKFNIKLLRNKIKNLFTKTNSSLLIEVMNNGAACRTYNILIGESRRVVAVLISV